MNFILDIIKEGMKQQLELEKQNPEAFWKHQSQIANMNQNAHQGSNDEWFNKWPVMQDTSNQNSAPGSSNWNWNQGPPTFPHGSIHGSHNSPAQFPHVPTDQRGSNIPVNQASSQAHIPVNQASSQSPNEYSSAQASNDSSSPPVSQIPPNQASNLENQSSHLEHQSTNEPSGQPMIRPLEQLPSQSSSQSAQQTVVKPSDQHTTQPLDVSSNESTELQLPDSSSQQELHSSPVVEQVKHSSDSSEEGTGQSTNTNQPTQTVRTIQIK